MDSLFSLKNKTVVITGGAGHLGKAMSEVLMEYGAIVIVASRNLEKNRALALELNSKYDGELIPESVDLASSESIDLLMKRIKATYGNVDVLINNSYYGAGAELTDMSDEEWLRGIDGSINSTYRMINAVLPDMINVGYGKIVNIASMYGVVAPDVSIYEHNDFYNPANYGVGKAGIIQLTKYLAAVYGKQGITCNSISPGPFPSPNVQKDTEFLKSLEAKVPLGRVGIPEELKGIVVLLASDASSYINGQNICVDGGWTTW